ncbi:PREDICTED: bromodomain-containing protein 7 [Nanorana parkeri]|uniref:bromodomain-containing protein 7 n=1 Tax=Nanorana parkeri TaxID=125878 RepID=UPI0008541DA1|nr:PREDICTED: bromodomain-containing protein 7 [Nanorana parkeri]
MPAPMYVSVVSAVEPQQQKELSVRRRDVITGIRKKILKGAAGEMGKKHKKHKGDKHGYEGKEEVRSHAFFSEYVEKPLKLVLKVGTGEVKELSTARATALPQGFHEDKTDHDKHKDKKKKKKKKNEKTIGPGEEKKKKKDDKKKKDKSHRESDPDNEHSLHSPLRPDLPAVSLPDSSLLKPEENQTPLQEALNQLIRQLQRKDPSSFFAFPVTDFIAPGYSMIIKNPMDFSTIKEKIKNDTYDSIEELKENFKQICHNAMIYNKPGTIYYKAAKKLLNSGMKILSQERIHSLKQSIDFMADLQSSGKDNPDAKENVKEPKEESMDTSDVAAFKTPVKDFKRKDKDQSEDKQRLNEGASEKDQEQIDQIIRDSLGKLTKRTISTQLEFERRKQDGTTTLALLNPGDTALEAGHGSAILGSTAGRLQTGVNCLQGFKEDKRNKVTPVSYLNYGPFTSYAPSYDSTFANIGKDDSDLIYTMYGEEPSLQGTFSLQEFLENIKSQPYGMVDCILDAFSNGEYSRTEREQNKATVSESSAKPDCVGTTDQFASLKSVFGLELFEETFDSEGAQKFQRKLDETTKLICELQEVQNERLSTKPPPNMVCLLAPSVKEVQIAEKVNENLKELTQQVNPGDVVSVPGIRKAMGIITPYVDTEEMVVDLTTADTQESQAIPKNGSECLQLVI